MSRRRTRKEEAQMCNQDIKALANQNHVRLWQVAEKLQIADTTFSRWLRTELPNEKKQQIKSIIEELSK